MTSWLFVIIPITLLLVWFLFRAAVDKEVEKHSHSFDEKIERLKSRIKTTEQLEKEIKDSYTDQYHEAEERLKAEYSKKYNQIDKELEKKYLAYYNRQNKECEILLKSSTEARPYLASLISDYLTYDLERATKKLETSFNMRLADKAIKTRELTKQLKELSYQYYLLKFETESLFAMYPKIEEYFETGCSDFPFSANLVDSDPIKNYISDEEYNKLSENERNQKSLDNYVSSHKKTKWQIGRDYELYVGYRLREKGFSVSQTGISDKLEDLGRDIIATKNSVHYIIQCKFWGKEKIIHEKHIAQLYGTTICYMIENHLSPDQVKAVFYTNIDFSVTAKHFAEYLSIKLVPFFDLGDYPRIKCKINYDVAGNKTHIYHLPMDQQYDSTQINLSKGDMYAFTVQEAVDHGFRRAYKWHGN